MRASARGPDSDAHAQLAQMVRHAAFREFPDLLEEYAESGSEPPAGDAHAETTCPPLLASAFLRRSGAAIVKSWAKDETLFHQQRAKYLLYR